jgi:PKD repeat protein
VFSPTAAGIYDFTVTVTNNYGCSTVCHITICVLDIRVPGTDGKKVYICHAPPGNSANSQTQSVNINGVNAHLQNHPGDKLGQCGQDPCGIQSRTITSGKIRGEESLKISVLPNPSKHAFTLSIESDKALPVTIRILDVQGREINRLANLPGPTILNVGDKLKTGIYLAEVLQGKERKIVKLVKIE